MPGKKKYPFAIAAIVFFVLSVLSYILYLWTRSHAPIREYSLWPIILASLLPPIFLVAGFTLMIIHLSKLLSEKKMNRLAIISLICILLIPIVGYFFYVIEFIFAPGLLVLIIFLVPALLVFGFVLAIISLIQIMRNPKQSGQGYAISAILLSIGFIIFYVMWQMLTRP